MKDKIFSACEGALLGYLTHTVWEDAAVSIMVTVVCAVITVLIQHFLKRWLNTRAGRLPKFKSNGKS